MIYINKYLEFLVNNNYAENTLITYKNHIRHFLKYCIRKNIDYNKFTSLDLLNYTTELKKEYSNSTVNLKLSIIKELYQFLKTYKDENINIPYTKIIRKINKSEIIKKAVNKKTKDDILYYLERKNNEVILIGFKIMFNAGLRVSELVNFKKDDLIEDDKKNMYIYISESKHNIDRFVPIIDEDTVDSLRNYVKYISTDVVIDRTARAFQYQASNIAEYFNIDFTIHSCRHTFATEQIQKNMPIVVLQKILGHKSIETTMRYVDISFVDVVSYMKEIAI